MISTDMIVDAQRTLNRAKSKLGDACWFDVDVETGKLRVVLKTGAAEALRPAKKKRPPRR
jgi:hypothetical protein